MRRNFFIDILGCLLGSLLFFSCGQQEDLSTFEKIALERPEIEAYAESNGLDGTFNSQGVYVVIISEGDTASDFASTSSSIDLMYVGRLLSGQIFSDTGSQGFRLSSGELPTLSQLLPGLESGLKSFRKEGQGTLIIPSPLAYETYGSTDGTVPPNAILRFDFTILDLPE